MKTNFELTKELHNGLIEVYESRIKSLGYKGKKAIEMQAEFLLGAVCMLDLLNGDKTKTVISPTIAFSIMRGELIKKFNP